LADAIPGPRAAREAVRTEEPDAHQRKCLCGCDKPLRRRAEKFASDACRARAWRRVKVRRPAKRVHLEASRKDRREVFLPAGTWAGLARLAKAEGLTRSGFLRRLLAQLGI
jgi:hypothetical protein